MGTYRPKPVTAAWIAKERKRLGLSVDALREKLKLYGVTVSRQTIQVWESYADRKPSAQNLDALERIFGSQAPEKPAPEGTAGLAEALTALTDELRAMREERQSTEARLRALEAAVALLGQPADEGPRGQVPPRVEAGSV